MYASLDALDDMPAAPIDARLLLKLMEHLSAPAHDRDDAGSIKRALTGAYRP